MVNRDQQIAAMIHSVRHANEDCLLELLQWLNSRRVLLNLTHQYGDRGT